MLNITPLTVNKYRSS